MKPPVVLTGPTGLVGQHLRPALADRQVVLLCRRAPGLHANERWIPTDLREPLRLPPLPAGSVFCHLAYAMADGPRNLDYTGHVLDAVNAAPEISRVVLVSSISVYGLGLEGEIDERTPCHPDSEYARTKLGCERLWFEALRPDCQLAVLRPGAVLAVRGNALATLTRDAVQRIHRGLLKRAVMGTNSVHIVPVQNVVAAIAFAVDREDGGDRDVFIVCNDEAPENFSYARMQDAIREIAGRPPLPTLPTPRVLQRLCGTIIRRPLGVRRSFSSRALREAGFVDAVSLHDELDAFVRTQLRVPERVAR